MLIAVIIVAVFLLLLGNEVWWRRQKRHNELSRKFIHITVGSFVATWPFYLTWDQIRFMSLAFLIVVLLSKWLGIFKSVHSVQRPTGGEICFALAVGAITYITQDPWIYAAALLQMSLADGMAAIVGVKFGKNNQYKIFKHVKSLAGTATFVAVSIIIFSALSVSGYLPIQASYIVGLALAAALLENLGGPGLDNLLVPVLVATVLSQIVG